jgi:hypothetical protein
MKRGLLPTFCDQRQSITTATLWSYFLLESLASEAENLGPL